MIKILLKEKTSLTSMAPRQFFFILLLLIVGCHLRTSFAHKIHVVGGGDGWKIPPNITFYAEWAATRTFVVGDKLVFLYRTSSQNVLEVSADDYEKCGNSNVLEIYYIGPTIVELNLPGPHFFYSGIGLHCEAGQKLAVNVATTAPPPPYVSDDSLYSLGSHEAAPAPAPTMPLPPPTVLSSAVALRYVAPAVAGAALMVSWLLYGMVV